MNKITKLSFLIPTYNAQQFLEANLSLWKELKNYVDLIFVEDSKDESSKKIVHEIGGQYHSKDNGNWGSVINFAKENKLIKTKYMAVVDPDDLININDLRNLIDKLGDADLYITKQENRNITTKKTYFYTPKKNIFVHASWFKTEIFYKLNDLPENISYTDTLLMENVLSYVKTFERLNLAPYIYHEGFPGQSMAIKWPRLKKLSGNLIEFKTYSNLIPKSQHCKSLQKRSSISSEYVLYFLMLGSYSGANKEERKEISLEMKKVKFFKRPFTTWLIWKRLELIFKRQH